MPSFDVVSEVDMHQLTNAVDQARRVVDNRFDFKSAGARFEQEKLAIELYAEADFQLDQMVDVLRGTLIKCKIDPKAMEVGEPSGSGKGVRKTVTFLNGLAIELCKKIVKEIKVAKLKVTSAIQDEQVRVTGKKRDDLQQVMALLREGQYDQPLQFTNFRD
ncbi:MAG: YajQ family cyclic di-GMP-binding protein [Pseudomonadales bacterium]